jgi:hypothetical protein
MACPYGIRSTVSGPWPALAGESARPHPRRGHSREGWNPLRKPLETRRRRICPAAQESPPKLGKEFFFAERSGNIYENKGPAFSSLVVVSFARQDRSPARSFPRRRESIAQAIRNAPTPDLSWGSRKLSKLGKRIRFLTERSGNVYENKGPDSGNLIVVSFARQRRSDARSFPRRRESIAQESGVRMQSLCPLPTAHRRLPTADCLLLS